MGNKQGGPGGAGKGAKGGGQETKNDATTIKPLGDSEKQGQENLTVDPKIGSLSQPLRMLPLTKEDERRLTTQEFANYSEKLGSKKLSVESFDLLKVVGKGSFGKVMQVRKKDTGKVFAMKVLSKANLVKRKQVAHTQTERRVLEDIDNPFIVGLRYAFQTSEKLYLVLDYFTGGELFFHLKNGGKFNEQRAKFYAAEIAIAMQCLHDHQIVYRDLKPENVLLDDLGHVRLTDFGLAKEGVSTTKLTATFCGTPEYLAPEVIHGQGYGTPIDWWALGCLLFEMLTGMPPFYNQNLHVLYEKIVRGKIFFPAELSAEAKSVLTALLERNPKLRLGTRGGLEDIKKHPFFATIDFDKLYKKELDPPFKPESKDGKNDTLNVDEEFTKETPKDTPVMASTLAAQAEFPDFTYKGADAPASYMPQGSHRPQPSWDLRMLGQMNDQFLSQQQIASAKPLRFEDVDRDSDEERD